MSLFDQHRYIEAEDIARSMTEKFPLAGFGWKVLGATLKLRGLNEDALAPFRRAVELSPSDAESHNNLGITFKDLGALAEAENHYRRALEINPNFVDALSNLGAILQDQGRLNEALGTYSRALQIKPDHTDALSNFGSVLKEMGHLDKAEASCRQAIQIKEDYANGHNNLGAVLYAKGCMDDAESSFRRALQIDPNFVGAYNNLALLLISQREFVAAFDASKRSLLSKETTEAKKIFASCLQHVRSIHDDRELRTLMTRAISEPWSRPNDLAPACISLIKVNHEIGGLIARSTDSWPTRLSEQDLFGANGLTALVGDHLLDAVLVSVPVCDVEMERFLTMVRHAMLENMYKVGPAEDESNRLQGFYSALARQCFINEYVFSQTDDETKKAFDLRNALVSALEANGPVSADLIVAVACYFSLGAIPFASKLLEAQWPNGVREILVQQVTEPLKELQFRCTIPRLTIIDDGVSLDVKNQYEENPYPRWIKPAPSGNAMPVDAVLRGLFPLVPFHPMGKESDLDILIAGCGTGQHSIGSAQRFKGARVLAIDLSKSSLGYAKRKTQELGLSSIEYAQADLLKLQSLGRDFDVIESSGVLHHLADPLAGWRVLLSLLRPGGFMNLGFYSETGRRNLAPMRAFISNKGYGATANEIRQCRQELIDAELFEKSSDFFSVSACRDLLFHVQEHRLTLPEIDGFLRENGLAFLGFEIDSDVLNAYKLRVPDDQAATNLEQWHIFENENPDTFVGMYQFWVQKIR